MVVRLFYGCSTVVLIGFTCPAITVGTVILRALVSWHSFDTVAILLLFYYLN